MEIEWRYMTPSGNYYSVDRYTHEDAMQIAEMRACGYCDADPVRLKNNLVVSVFVPTAQCARFRSDFTARFGAELPATLQDKTRIERRDWYEHRDELRSEMVFRTTQGEIVKLDRRVPGDGTKWYVADWSNGWFYEDGTLEPGDLDVLLSTDGSVPTPGPSLSRPGENAC